MSSNTTPQRISDLLSAVFEILWNSPDGLPAREVISLIPNFIQLTENELEFVPASGFRRYEKIIRLVTVPLSKAGWLLKNERGFWSITEDGKQACKKFANAQELFKEAIRVSDEHKKTFPEIVVALETAQEMAWMQIEKYIQQLKHNDLKIIVTELLLAMGYHLIWTSASEKNRNQVDMLFSADPLGVKGNRIFVQVKKNIGQVITAEGIRSFSSILGENDFGLVISTSGFTGEIKQELSADYYRKIHILDTASLLDLWISHYDKLRQEAKKLFPLTQVYFLAGIE